MRWKPRPKAGTVSRRPLCGVANGPPAGSAATNTAMRLEALATLIKRPVRQRTGMLKKWLKSNQTTH